MDPDDERTAAQGGPLQVHLYPGLVPFELPEEEHPHCDNRHYNDYETRDTR